jgi:hypothetical protein
MSKYRIVERIDGLGKKHFHLEEDRLFGWREVQYSVGMDCSAPTYHKTVESAREERDRLLEIEKKEKLSNKIISTRIIE